MTSYETSSEPRKRKLEEDSNEREESLLKRKYVEESSANILDLADETLIEILKQIDSESLMNLGQTCLRFWRLSKDKNLWNNVIFTSKEYDIYELMVRLRYINLHTKILALKGNCKKENYIVPPSLQRKQLFKAIIKRIAERSPFLEKLYLTQITFDWSREFSMSKFPRSLKVLSFSHCIMPQNRLRAPRTFTGIHEDLPNLQTLKIEYCNFFAANDLMSFSKLPNLVHLSLRGCPKMRSSVPYLSLACRFGFQKLEIFDVRETHINDGEVQCLNSIKTLKEIYLEYPEIDPSETSDDDDDDLRMFVRRSNTRAMREPPVLSSLFSQPVVHNRSSNEQSSSSFSINENNSDFSDSIPSSDSEEEVPTRTIVIRANINAGNDPNQQNQPRIQVVMGNGADIPLRYLQMDRQRRETVSVTDRGILSFGIASRGNLICLGNHDKDKNTYLEKIILRKFSDITNATLLHLESNAPNLVYLDVKGCSQITRETVERFKAARSNCKILSNFDIEE